MMEKKILEAIEEYLNSEESYGDTAMLCIDPAKGEVSIVDGEELTDDEMENSDKDYYDVMDLLEMDQEEGAWHPDTEAIAEIATEYT